jgi:AcrR family transcriptional regulator
VSSSARSVKKSEKTKNHIYQVAIHLFSTKGFDATSMREIAERAGVAAGATYYYFPSKEALVHEYYKRSHYEHLEQVEDCLKKEKEFAKRLHQVVTAKIRIAEPHKEMAQGLFRVASDPTSALSPFNPPSSDIRQESIDLFTEVVNDSETRFHPDVKPLLPGYLWLYHMGIILYWIYDTSERSKKTFQLIDQTVPLIASLNGILLNPMLAFVRNPVVHLLQNFQLDRDLEDTPEKGPKAAQQDSKG